jgi:hypothetical protein
MDEVEVVRERETSGGWELTVRVGREAGARAHVLRLSWADHDHWTRGSASPSATGAAVVRAALELGETLDERIDAAAIARRTPDFADLVRRLLGGDGER